MVMVRPLELSPASARRLSLSLSLLSLGRHLRIPAASAAARPVQRLQKKRAPPDPPRQRGARAFRCYYL